MLTKIVFNYDDKEKVKTNRYEALQSDNFRKIFRERLLFNLGAHQLEKCTSKEVNFYTVYTHKNTSHYLNIIFECQALKFKQKRQLSTMFHRH